MPRFRWPPWKKLAFELVARGIGGRTVAELRRRMSTRELMDWADWRALRLKEEQAAGKRKQQIIHW